MGISMYDPKRMFCRKGSSMLMMVERDNGERLHTDYVIVKEVTLIATRPIDEIVPNRGNIVEKLKAQLHNRWFMSQCGLRY